MDKFRDELEGRFKDRIEAIERIKGLTDKIGRLLATSAHSQAFLPTAIQFAKICVEMPDSIMVLALQGNIAQSYVLLRWYLESSHLLWYLWKHPEEFTEWQKGKQIRANKIGRFFAASGLHPWDETYKEWSNVTHCNSPFLDHYSTISERTHKTEGTSLLIGNILVNIAFISMKTNSFLTEVLKGVQTGIPDSAREDFQEIEPILKQMWDEQREDEDKLMLD